MKLANRLINLKNTPFLAFTALNTVILFAGLSLYWVLWGWMATSADLVLLQSGIASIVFSIQNAFGVPITMTSGTSFFYALPEPGFGVEIIPLCIGLGEMLFFSFLLLFFRGVHWRCKVKGLAIFLPVVFAINIFRLLLLYPLAQAYGVEAMWDIHWHIWKWGMFAVIMALFTVWYMFIARNQIEHRIRR